MSVALRQVSIRGLLSNGCLHARAITIKMQKARERKEDYRENKLESESKYEFKTRKAEEAWAERAERIREGKEAHVWDILEERGFVKDVAGTRDGIRETMLQKRIGAYVGIDPTADTLHIGHIVVLMPLFWMYMHGHTTLTLIGGATAKIGDPTGRLQSRDGMDRRTFVANYTAMHYQLKKMWKNAEQMAADYGYVKDWAWRRGIENNSVWWNKQPMVEVLRMTLSRLTLQDSVKNKMEKGDGMSFSEFCYPLMQGWDFYQLYEKRGIQMQIGGSDQFGNIVAGIDVVKAARANEHETPKFLPIVDDVVGFTVPLLTDKAGNKFGKSAGNAVVLNAMQTTPYDLYRYFVGRADHEVEKLLKLFTFVPSEKIREIMEEHRTNPPKRVAQHLLALEVLRLVHGGQMATAIQKRHRRLHSKVGDGDDAEEFKEEEDDADGVQDDTSYPASLNDAPPPEMKLPQSLVLGKSVAKILYAARLADSIAEGNRLAREQSVYIAGIPGQSGNAAKKGRVYEQLQYTPVQLWFPQNTANFLIDGKLLILRKGKHNVRVIEVVSDVEWEKSGDVYPGQPNMGGVRLLRERLKSLKTALKKLHDAEIANAKGPNKESGEKRAAEKAQAEKADLSEPPVERQDAQSALLIPTKTDGQKAELRRKIRETVSIIKHREKAALAEAKQARGEKRSEQTVRGQLAQEVEAEGGEVEEEEEERPTASPETTDKVGDVLDQRKMNKSKPARAGVPFKGARHLRERPKHMHEWEGRGKKGGAHRW